MTTLLLHSPADIIRSLLVQEGLGVNPPIIPSNPPSDWAIFTDLMPPTPDNAIACIDQSGIDNGRIMIDGARVEHHGVNILIRSITHRVGYPKSKAIAESLDKDIYDEVVVLDGTSYLVHSTNRAGDILRMGKDSSSSKRSQFSISIMCTIRMLQ